MSSGSQTPDNFLGGQNQPCPIVWKVSFYDVWWYASGMRHA